MGRRVTKPAWPVMVLGIVVMVLAAGCSRDLLAAIKARGVPSGLSITAGDGEVTVSWEAVAGAASYNLYWSTSGGVSTSGTRITGATPPYTHTGLTNGTSYSYAAAAVNAGGESALSSEVSATPQVPAPGVPSGVSVTAGDTEVTVSWDAVTGADSYTIYWNASGGVAISDDQITEVASPYTHTGLTNGTSYHYVITAVSAGGESALSSEVSATPQVPVPGVPSGVSVTAGDTEVTVSWDAVSGADAYNLYWNTSGGVTTLDNRVSDATSPYTHAGLANGTSYFYVVTAVSAGGESALSSELGATPQVPAPPGVSAAAGTREVTVTWDEVASADSYTIYWNMSGAVTTSDNQITEVVSPYTHTDRPNGLTCYYVVTASNTSGESSLSSEVNATPTFSAQQLVKLVASDAQAGDDFGYAVSISGDYAIVGAREEDGGAGDPLVGSGAVYIFHRTGTDTWEEEAELVASDAQIDDRFGCSVAISGDDAIVGAYAEDGGAGDPLNWAGAAYIFHRTGIDTWEEEAKLVALDAQADDQLGMSAAISGDYAIVGAVGESGFTGAAYIFHRTGIDTWAEEAKLVASDAQAGDDFGCSVSISGDYAIAGARDEDGGAGNPLSAELRTVRTSQHG